MEKELLRKEYVFDEPNGRGNNKDGVDRWIQMLEKHLKSNNPYICSITQNVELLKRISPNFTIFKSEKSFFLVAFNALTININDDKNYLILSHEYGHALHNILLKDSMPDNYDKIIENAKEHCKDPEVNQRFSKLVRVICNREDSKDMVGRDPFSDIISAIYQASGFNTKDGDIMLPAYHNTKDYMDDQNNIDYKKVFREHIADFFALEANNCTEEISMLRDFFGEEFVNTLDYQFIKMNEVINVTKNYYSNNKAENTEETKFAI